MPIVLHEVPGHVRLADHTQNQVQVRGGTNWDFSRSAVATPISQLSDPEPLLAAEPEPRPAPAQPLAVITFRANSSVVSKQGARELATLKPGVPVFVVGYADHKEAQPEKLALQRAEAVARRIQTSETPTTVRIGEILHSRLAPSRKVEVTLTDPSR